MKTLKELLIQKQELDARIDHAFVIERSAALAQVRELVQRFCFTSEQVFPLPGAGRFKPKYRDPVTGATWSGVGKPPRWIAGKDRAEFEIKPVTPALRPSRNADPSNPFPVQ